MAYTEQELIDELHRVSEEHCDGERPRGKEIDEYSFSCSSTYDNKFGSWTKALKEANLFEKERDDSRISKSGLKEEINRLSKQYCQGGTPSQTINEEHGKYSITPYQDKFGSWNKAVKACGYKPNIILGVSDEEALEEIRRVSEEHCDGDTPRQKDMIKHGKWYRDIYLERFGTWSNAVEKAGFEPNTPYDFIKSGSEHPLWREDVGYGDSWEGQKQKCLERDNYRCRVCFKTEKNIGKKPSVHHIRPKYLWNVKEEHEEMNSLDNLVCLCVSCHRKLEEDFIHSSTKTFIEKSRKKLGIGKS